VPPRDWPLRVQDILEAIGRIERHTRGLDFEGFRRSELAMDAVIRNFEVIGEAARFISSELETRHPDVPWADMRGFRNVLVHEYFGVNTEILWETAKNELPKLVAPLRRILETET